MNKKIIAAAIAAGLYAPIAVSAAPTVYGRAQVELGSFDYGNPATSDKTDLIDNNMGRVGVKGSEDLGGGLTALYKWEFATHTDDNEKDDTSGASLTGRKSYVGLKGNFGEVHLGNDSSPYKDTNLDPFNATLHEARNGRAQSHGGFGHSGFVEKAVKYTNKFGPVKFGLLYGLYSDDDDTNNQSNEAEDSYSVAGDYSGGPLRVVVAHSSEAANAGNEDRSRTKFAAQFKTGPWEFTGQYETVEGNSYDATTDDDIDYTYIAAAFNMGKNTIYARVGERDQAGTASDSDHMALVLRHKMSKKTRTWVGFSTDDGDGVNNDEDRLTAGMRVDF